MKLFLTLLALFGLTAGLSAQLGASGQPETFTRQDSLRGSITPERAWWDLNYYSLDLRVNPEEKSLSGTNTIRYRVLEPATRMQIDLQQPLQIDSVWQDGQRLDVTSEGNAHFVQLRKVQRPGAFEAVHVAYSGKPREAVRAPWDGGFSWDTDSRGQPFAATSCQGLGASAWWPNKDHMYDEPDSMAIAVRIPKPLMNVSNGRLRQVTDHGDSRTYHWFVSNPINNYGVNVNIADYAHFGDTYAGENGDLDLDYYVLPENLEKAKNQFGQVPLMLEAFEHWFGPYPFYEDSFKLVEVPYLGMEHQSSVTYGNGYSNGYLGRDLSGTGWGLKFDFIIIHEAGHEWFANNITYRDIADMWIHEGFTAYSENLYLDYHFGTEAAAAYVIGTRRNIKNDRPLIGTYGVNREGSPDMYYKGANMLHTLRQLVEDDALWRSVLRGLNAEFRHQTVTTAQVEHYMSERTGKNLSAFFDQYLRTTMIPTLEYRRVGDRLEFRYTEIVDGFDMPIRILANGEPRWIFPEADWKSEPLKADAVLGFDANFYIHKKPVPAP
ncbi:MULTISPECIES: M1 family metallopeptidase [unclassified Robiginitalea]|uniref:M1 family metallopeptidase n=1 Tax=Robiginitalea TaxID=252306 RepID=UPI0023494654|nr:MULTISPECIES: M1 family metallopeptidase [unclassified Robiginitalea]MDC6355012.1 M1 family metallopeptidase [Robiginitalea sp. PM2]MDC6375279.1 M1 family metallopeptidase [Robiginitalea sp. SP8]